MALFHRRLLWSFELLLGISLMGCHDNSSSCAGGNGKMCDIFSFPLKLVQDTPRLHFTDWQVTEGACAPPRCDTTACTSLTFVGLYSQLEVTAPATVASPPDTRCRFQISSAEGESLDVVLSLAGSSTISFCCNTGLRKLIGYSWSAVGNGLELESDYRGFRLPDSLDGGVSPLDGASQG
jgi:hypothetical protein